MLDTLCMRIPQAKIANPSSTQRLSLRQERLNILKAWLVFLTSSATIIAFPLALFLIGRIGPGVLFSISGIVALVLLLNLWRSKSQAKLKRSLLLSLPGVGVIFYPLLNRPEPHGMESNGSVVSGIGSSGL